MDTLTHTDLQRERHRHIQTKWISMTENEFTTNIRTHKQH